MQVVSEADVIACVLWAKGHSIPIVARSGGHSYAAFSSTTGLLVDMSLVNSVTLEAGNMALLGGGVRNRDVYAALRPPSLSVTHGRCKDVGVAGLVLGGGIAFNMRAKGLTCDRLVETRIVLHDGTAITCSATENADLFWALWGAGGGNFGIHTEFVFSAFPVTSLATFSISWNDKLEEVFAAIQTMSLAAPSTLGIKTSVISPNESGSRSNVVNILGQLLGSEQELQDLLDPIYAVANPSSSTIRTLSYWDAQEFLSENGDPEYAHERSRFVYQPLSQEAISTIFNFMKLWPGTSKATTWKYFLMGGEIDKVKPTDTAFVHRNSLMISSIDLEWTESDSQSTVNENMAWLNSFHQAMLPFTSPSCFQNFIDRLETNYLSAYYGENLPRLREVKTKYDPKNVFNYMQSIPVLQ